MNEIGLYLAYLLTLPTIFRKFSDILKAQVILHITSMIVFLVSFLYSKITSVKMPQPSTYLLSLHISLSLEYALLYLVAKDAFVFWEDLITQMSSFLICIYVQYKMMEAKKISIILFLKGIVFFASFIISYLLLFYLVENQLGWNAYNIDFQSYNLISIILLRLFFLLVASQAIFVFISSIKSL